MSFLTGTVAELLFASRGDHTAVSNTNAEASLLAGPNRQATLPPQFFEQAAYRALKVEAFGVLSVTATPTIIFQARLGSTIGSTYLSGTSVGVSNAATMQSGITNKWWRLDLLIACLASGQGAGNTSLWSTGSVVCPGGFNTPFTIPLEPTTPDTGTWTSTIDDSVSQFLNLSVTWSAASASNTCQCKGLFVYGLN